MSGAITTNRAFIQSLPIDAYFVRSVDEKGSFYVSIETAIKEIHPMDPSWLLPVRTWWSEDRSVVVVAKAQRPEEDPDPACMVFVHKRVVFGG